MKNMLLITTAITGIFYVLPCQADQGATGLLKNGDVLSGIYTNFENTNSSLAGVATITYGVTDVTVADGTQFTNNVTKKSAGGALKIMNGMTVGDNIEFSGNKAVDGGWGGGALYIKLANGKVASEPQEVTTGKVTFKNNSAGLGGAIALEQGILTIGNDSLFDANSAQNGSGGAIAVWKDVADHGEDLPSTLKTLKTTFSNNSANLGGAIFNASDVEIGSDSLFENNSAHAGGAIYAEAGSETTVADNVIFKNNKAEAQVENGAGDAGGAVYLFSDAKFTAGNNVSFIGNTALAEQDENTGAKGAAGAFYAYKSDVTLGDKANFENNQARYAAGALYNWEGKVSIGSDATFKNNSSLESYAGAIGNFDGDMNIGANAVFEGNKAAKEGGAIANKTFSTDSTKLNIGANSTFKNNEANIGGAVYNQAGGILTLNGDATFSGNKDAKGLNDIHNEGLVQVNAGNLTLDGGISGNGTTEFAKGTKLTVNTGTTTISNKIVNNGADLNLVFNNGFSGTYNLIVDDGSLDTEFNIGENKLYNIKAVKNGSYEIAKKSSDELSRSTGATTNQSSAVVAITSGKTNNQALDTLADYLSNSIQTGTDDEIKTGMDAVTAVSPEVAPMVQKTQTETVNQIFSAVSTRLSGGSVASSGAEGIASGDSLLERAAVWIQGLFGKSKLDDTAKAKGFDAKTKGVAFGIEKYLTDSVKAGIGYAYNTTDIDGFMRDTDVDSNTALVYAEYKPCNWFVNGIASYGWADYDESKNVMGMGVYAGYDVETLGLQVMTGYDMAVKEYTLTPEAGLRYLHIKQDAYTDTAGQRVSSQNSDIFTGVVGAKVSKAFYMENGMVIRPQLRAAATYDFANDGSSAVVTLANGSAYAVNGKALKRFGMEFGAGITADVNDNVELSVAYEGKFRKDYHDNTGLINAKYKF